MPKSAVDFPHVTIHTTNSSFIIVPTRLLFTSLSCDDFITFPAVVPNFEEDNIHDREFVTL